MPKRAIVLVVLSLFFCAAGLAAEKLTPPRQGKIDVAFLISDGAVVIDFAGPWAVFEGVRNEAFNLYTVAETRAPVRASSGMRVVPDYSFADAPRPRVLVIPAQGNHDAAVLDWIRKTAATADVTMSVCTGAFLLAEAGLLDGRRATTFHVRYDRLAQAFPRIRVARGARWVEDGPIATAGGLSSGIDLALRVVERYFGRAAADETAYDLEYQGQGWRDARANAIYARAPAGIVDPVCGMTVRPEASVASQYRGKTYYFCSEMEKREFDAHPERYAR